MDGIAYDLCVVCGDYVFDYEADDLGEAFFAFGTALPSHHNDCLRERFAVAGTLDPAYVANNKPETVLMAQEFLSKRTHSLGSRDLGDSPPPAGPATERPAAWTPGGVVPVFPCRYAFPGRDTVLFPNVVNARQAIRSPYEQRLVHSVVRACPTGAPPGPFFLRSRQGSGEDR
jgi:hypothetical protein